MSGGHNNYTRLNKQEDEVEDEGGTLVRNEGEKRRQYQAAILAALAATAAGTSDGWLLTSTVKQNVASFNKDNLRLFTNIMNFSAIIGSIISWYLVEKIGRKHTLILAGLLILPTWILYMISHKILISLSIGTALGGIASGAVSVAVPLYIAEISETSTRGTLGILFYLQFVAGELFTAVEGRDASMTAVSTLCIMVTTIFLVTFIWMPESPYSLVAKGEDNEAKLSIKFFRGANYHTEEEVENLKQSVSRRTNFIETLKEDNTINAILLSLLLMFISRLIAVDGFNFRLLKLMIHSKDDTKKRVNAIVLLLELCGIAASTYLIEKLGRRKLLIISASVMAFCAATFFLLYTFSPFHDVIFLITMAIYLIAYSIGAGPIPWVLMNELVPHQHKALSSTLSATLFWFMAFTSTARFYLLEDLLGYVTIIYYMILCILLVIVVVFLLPETKGRNLNTITLPNIKNFILRKRNTNTVNVV